MRINPCILIFFIMVIFYFKNITCVQEEDIRHQLSNSNNNLTVHSLYTPHNLIQNDVQQIAYKHFNEIVELLHKNKGFPIYVALFSIVLTPLLIVLSCLNTYIIFRCIMFTNDFEITHL